MSLTKEKYNKLIEASGGFTKKYKTEWCEECKCDIVTCPGCGETCHYGSIGKIQIRSEWFYDDINHEYFYNTKECTECADSYKYQEQIAPDLANYYGKVFTIVDGKEFELGSTNSNHHKFTFTPTENINE